ncbi:hypothetical protein WN944_021107 [Citrus x changshan-huyou]|uniref:Uncharacterized protein n=1 Tax=Citrus x changshan-huyou TaxID=2935761 RepID=A0AAP0N2J0_9ROSI
MPSNFKRSSLAPISSNPSSHYSLELAITESSKTIHNSELKSITIETCTGADIAQKGRQSFPEVMDNPNVSRWCFSEKDKNFSTGIEIANREPSS